jgi:hypothetical protein
MRSSSTPRIRTKTEMLSALSNPAKKEAKGKEN